jgi:hypothetical protein
MKKYELEIEHDNDPLNPRTEWDNLGTMVCFHKSYNLGDKTDYKSGNYDSWDELEKDIIKCENVGVILPLYLYDHSGITMNTTGFSCNWDSGRVGFIFISKEKMLKEYGGKIVTKKLKDKVTEYLKGEVETYDKYLTGDVHIYKLYEVTTCDLGHEHKELVESCGGYFGEEECRSEGESMMKYYMENELVG